MSKLLAYIKLVKKAISNSANQNESLLYYIGYAVRKQWLENEALSSKKQGIAEVQKNKCIIVSLTTHGQRINTVYKAIESIFQQTMKANKVVLYLSEREFCGKELPILIQNQMRRGLEIRYVKDLRAYTKLIPAICEFPDDIIITIDDDYMYPVDTIEKLVSTHNGYQKSVICHASREIKLRSSTQLCSYSSFSQIFPQEPTESISYLAEGFGAVLYPPHCMHEDVIKEEIFMKLSPLADDLWYKCMQLLVGTTVVQIPRNRTWFSTMYSDDTVQDIALANQNVNENKNDPQFTALFDYYNLYKLFNK